MSSTSTTPEFKNYKLSQTPCPVLVFQTLTRRTMGFSTPPPSIKDSTIAFPTPSVLLITLNRPKDLNCINTQGHYELEALYAWFDAEPTLRVCVLTGEGRAFCAGADLKEWHTANSSTSKAAAGQGKFGVEAERRSMPPSGFGALSRRGGKKPVICAVNGICMGGGTEMIVNADIVIAETQAIFGLPEVKIGVMALAGALPRLVRTVGRQRAMEMALTGRTLPAEEAREWGLVNKVVPKGESVREAVKMAEVIAGNSPDSIIVTREAVKIGWDGVGAEEGTRLISEVWYPRMDKGENMKEGVRSFVEKRKPKWVASKL
jgi:enoyl-CoA hydratase/carnithine racemase